MSYGLNSGVEEIHEFMRIESAELPSKVSKALAKANNKAAKGDVDARGVTIRSRRLEKSTILDVYRDALRANAPSPYYMLTQIEDDTADWLEDNLDTDIDDDNKIDDLIVQLSAEMAYETLIDLTGGTPEFNEARNLYAQLGFDQKELKILIDLARSSAEKKEWGVIEKGIKSAFREAARAAIKRIAAFAKS